MSGTPLMARSIMTSTESTRILALAPGNEMGTTTLGGATEGNCEMGNGHIDNPPMNRMSSEMTIARAGRWRNFSNTTEWAALFRVILQFAKHFFRSAELVLNLVAIADLSQALQDDFVVFLEPLIDHKNIVLRSLRRDVALMNHLVFADDISIALRQNLKGGPLGNYDDVVERRMDQNGAGLTVPQQSAGIG